MANADVEAVDFNFDDDDLMDEEAPEPAPRLRSAIAGGGGGDGARRTKGRGFREDPNSSAPRDSSFAAGGRADTDSVGGSDPVRCTLLCLLVL
jgi:RNA-binding protein 8A